MNKNLPHYRFSIVYWTFIFCFPFYINSQDNTFFRKYNLYGMQGGLQLNTTSDGGFIATGQHEGNGGNGECDIYVYRVDLCGNIVWFKLYGTDSQEGGKSIKQTADGGFIVSGLGPANSYPRAFNMKLDSDGNIEWGKRYPGEWLLYSKETINGDFLNLSTGVLMRTDSLGNVLWRKNIGFMGSMSLWLAELPNGDIVVTSTGNGSDIYVGRFTASGSVVWIKKYGNGYSDSDHVTWSAKGVINNIENSICVTSPTYLGSQGGENILVMKLNLTDGSIIWSKAIGGSGSDQSRDIQLFPSGYAIAGNTNSYPTAINLSQGINSPFSERDALLFTLDENGNEIWSRSYGGDERDKAIGVQYNSDNGFTIAAYTSSSVFGNFDSSMDPLFIKTDSVGIVACQTNSPPLNFQNVTVNTTVVTNQPSNEGLESYPLNLNTLNYNPSDSYICQECVSTPLFQVSDTAFCVGDTVCFTNTTIIGLTCFQQWYINGEWFNGEIDPCYSFNNPGEYTIQLMSTCGVNADTFDIVINVYPIPTVGAGEDTEFCVGGSLTLSGSGADTYVWSDGVINNIPFYPNESEQYSVVGTTIHGCPNYDTINVIINLTPEIQSQDTILCSGITCGISMPNNSVEPFAANYSITSINSNGLIPSAGNPNIGDSLSASEIMDDVWINTNSDTIDVIYSIVPYSSFGCEGTPFIITLSIKPEAILSNQVTTVCSDKTIEVFLGNDLNGPYVQSWNIIDISLGIGLVGYSDNSTIGTYITNNEIFNDKYTNLTNDTVEVLYSVIPTGINDCISDTNLILVTINPEPIVSDQAATVCSDVACAISLGNDTDGPSATTYNILNINAGGLVPSAGTPLVANGVLNSNLFDDAWTNTTNAPVDVIYTIVPISAAACEGTPFTVTLTINPEPVVSNQALTLCSDIACGVTLGDDIDGPTASTYNITAINSNGLSASAGTPLVAIGVLNSNLIDDAWTNTTNAPVDVIYTIVPISAIGCEGTPFTVTITVNPEPIVLDQVTTVCSDVACGLTLANDINGPTASTFNITAINSNGLSSSAGNPLVANGVSNSNLIDDAWTNTTNAPVDVIYTIVPISAIGCEGTPFTVTLAINPEPIVSDQAATVCSDVACAITLGNDTDGPSATTYNILNINTGGLVPSAGTPLVANGVLNSNLFDDTWTNTTNAPVDVIYTIVPISAAGCEGNPFTVTITVNPEPVVSNQVATVCSDVACAITLGNDTDGPSATTYNILNINTGGLVPSAGTPLVANGILNSNLFDDTWTNTTNAPVNVNYTIVPISAMGCAGNSFTVTLTINPEPIVLNQIADICSEDLVTLTLNNDNNGPIVSEWNITNISFGALVPNLGNISIGLTNSNQYIAEDIYVNNTTSGIDAIYLLIPRAINGCLGSPFSVTITVNPLPIFTVLDVEVCAEKYVTLTGNPSTYSYIWDHGITNNVPFIPPYTDIYNVTATNITTGCNQDASSLVTVHPNPTADFTFICGDIQARLTNTSTGAVNYYWDMGDGSPIITSKDLNYIFSIMDSLNYTVTLIAETEFDCRDTLSKIFVTPLVFYIPNTFTPDENEHNNIFNPVFSHKNKVENYNLLIFNRWGELVFETNDMNFGWDGTYNNQKAQVGTYSWKLSYKNLSCIEKNEQITGHVNLLR